MGWLVCVSHGILPVLLPTSPETECVNFSHGSEESPHSSLDHLKNGFENRGHQNNRSLLLLTHVPTHPSPVFTLSGLTHKAFWDSWTIQGICSPVHSGPCHKERRTFITTQRSPVPPFLPPPCTPSSCLYITLPSASVHPRPDVFTLSPFFIMRKNRKKPRHRELGQSHKVLLMLDTWLERELCILRCDCFVVQKRAGFAEENQAVHFWELNFARTRGFTIYDIEKDKC